MFQTFQIVTLLQGLFLLLLLYKNKRQYIFTHYFYLNASLISLLIYLLGDTNSNLFISDFDFFIVDNTLFIVFLFLFLKNFNQPKPIQILKIAPYFLPVVVYVFIEVYEMFFGEPFGIESAEHFLYLIFIGYLVGSLYYTLNLKVAIVVKIPFLVLVCSLLTVYLSSIFSFVSHFESIEHYRNFNTILIFVIAFVFYYLSYLFAFNSSFINQPIIHNKYKNSSLNEKDIQEYIQKIKEGMESEKLYLNANLSLQHFSESVRIPKHFISEILNVHLQTNFQDFVNEYRVEEFIRLYTNPDNKQYSILGIATSCGFKNKATFNTNFKKIKGVSPTEYKHNHTI